MTRLRWLPNAITIARLAALPFLIWLVANAEGPTSAAVGWTFAILCATDFVDGKLARALNAESRFGRIADPFADRVLMAVGLIALIVLDRFAWPGPTIILLRDAVAVAAFVILSRRGVVLHVDRAGKVSSAVAMIAVGAALFLDGIAADVYFWFAVTLSVVTFVNYAVRARRTGRLSGST